MCGIVYRKSFLNENVTQSILQMYKNQRSRGTQGFGFYIPKTNKIKHETIEQNMVKLLKRTNASEMLFHHRMPTSTENVLNACHPFEVKIGKTKYVVVHNGYLFNDNELKKNHYKLGYEYSSMQENGQFNDSEALAYDIALTLSGKQKKLKAEGAIAFIAQSEGKIYFGRNTQSPLHYHINDKFVTIRSEGRGMNIKPDILYTFDNGKLTERDFKIPEYTYYTGGWSDGYGQTYSSDPLYDGYADDDYLEYYDYDTVAEVDKAIAKNQQKLVECDDKQDYEGFINAEYMLDDLHYQRNLLTGSKEYAR